MRVASQGGSSFFDKVALRLRRWRYRWYRRRRYRRGEPKTVAWIVGCQRSGTTLMVHLFELDRDTAAFQEYSALTVYPLPHDPVLHPLPKIQRILDREPAPLVVAKPLVASQDLFPLLELFPVTRAIWMFRHYAEVAVSSVRHFGPRIPLSDLAPIIAGDPDDWRSAGLDPAVRETIRRLHRPGMPPLDAAALFWLARNSLFFSQNLANDPRVALCRYGDLLADPAGTMRAVYAFLNRPYPGDYLVREVLPRRSPPRELALDPAIREVCQEMLERLESLPRLGA